MFLAVIVLFACLASATSQSLPKAKIDSERQASMFKVPGQDGEQWLALPEVMSRLDFYADSSPVSEEDVQGQMRLRDTRFWGRLYIEGWPQTIQYFRAHFGSSPPMGRKQFVFAEPRDACAPLTNAAHLTADHVVLVNRGTCTYGTKAKNVMQTAASAIIIINNEPGLDHLPGPDAHDIEYSVVSIPQQEGQLLESLYDDGPSESGSPFGRALHGYMVPINCENSGAKCVPATYDERRWIKESALDGGYIHVLNEKHGVKADDKPLEYLLAHFGTKVSHAETPLQLAVARPAEACSTIENDVKGKAVLVRRGGCPFVKKAEEVQAAGGRVVILGNSHPYIVRMGVEPRWKGLNTVVPVVMVSQRVYSVLVAESMATDDFQISLREDKHVNGTTWEPLEKLALGEGWPRSESYIEKKYAELKVEHAAWPDRSATVESAYAAKIKALASNVKKEGGDADAKSEL